MYRRILRPLLLLAVAASASAEAPPINTAVRQGFMTTALRATNCTTADKAIELAKTRVEQGAVAAYDKMQLYTAEHVCAVSDFFALQVGTLMYQGRVDDKDIVVVEAANYNGLYVMLVASYDQGGV